ncbi:MAG: VWA domain-containing protein [Candidatus Methanofastidiosia archaeon]
MNRRLGQMVVAVILFGLAVILCYYSIEVEQAGPSDVEIILVLDVSGSMGDLGTTGKPKVDEARDAAFEFLSVIDPDYEVGLVSFADAAQVESGLTKSKDTIRNKVSQLPAGGQTAMGDGIGLGIEELSRSNKPGAQYIVLMTDGLSNQSNKYTPEQSSNLARNKGIIVHSVAFGSDADAALLKKISDKTGGKYFFAATGADLVSVFGKIAEVINRRPIYYYGSRALLFVSVILIIFLPEIVRRTRMTLYRDKDRRVETKSYGGVD